MKLFKLAKVAVQFVSIVFVSLSSFAQATEPKVQAILRQTLVIGASVSADYLADSPGKKLARRYKDTNVSKVAAQGQPSTYIIKHLSQDLFDKSTVVIGLDFFFWDTVGFSSDIDDSAAVLKKVISMATRAGNVLILGTVPSIVYGLQGSRDELNKVIKSECSKYSRCRIFDLDKYNEQISRDGGIKARGKFHTSGELQPDGVHLGNLGNELVADRLQEILEKIP